ncbi:flavohemoglobin expression-modulating QEGLA motif protein [Sulfuriflexus mobilis]|uniref:flavohemoglobin expression-modulating QEGLA motif protein n=1 Tax=Sulfuriflexus mobilis TaxID=1811807 RepID=UPI000F82BFC3|nr:tyrosine/phenylalanine carboxypeptidase domain-containing protein [Sulfuriflexus mobilis]
MNGSADYISDALIGSITDAYQRNEPVRYKLRDGGRIHIDRQLPFLALYRRPATRADLGTERLLLGEASYLLADDRPEHQASLVKLIKEILSIQHKQFGACLLLELWSGAEVTDETRQPAFRIIAPKHGSPSAFLERMENALLNIRIDDDRPDVAISYAEDVTPPQQSLLLTKQELTRLNCLHIGLEVSPIYRDAETNTLLPFRWRRLHYALAHGLKRSFYAFTRHCTPLRPAHYLELGHRTMNRAVYETDERLTRINQQFELLLHVSPVNAHAAWQAFEQANCASPPEFLYRPRRVDPSLMKRELFAIPLERIEDPTLAHIFAQKREELDRQLTLIADRNTNRFLLGSRQLYGDVDAELLELARQVLGIETETAHSQDERGYLNPAELVERARQEIEYYRQQDAGLPARVELRDDVPGIMVAKGNFLVGTDASVSQARINATLAHEIGTHVLTHYNGSQQPFRELYAGMAGYESMQEGLAVLAEYLVGGLSRSRLRLLASRVLAVHMITEGANFIETFRSLLSDYDNTPYTAFTIAMRVFRGGGYTKDKVYLQGLAQVLSYLSGGGDLERLYLGKISYDYLPLIEELQWRQVLLPPRLRPRFLDAAETVTRLEYLRQGATVMDLMKEAV